MSSKSKKATTSSKQRARNNAHKRASQSSNVDASVPTVVTDEQSSNVDNVSEASSASENASADESRTTSESESASTVGNVETCADSDNASTSAQTSDTQRTNDDASASSASDDAPTLDDIASADEQKASDDATKTSVKKAREQKAPRVTRVKQQSQLHRALVALDALWTARLLYRSKRRMRLANVDVSKFPDAFIASDDASDEQKQRATTWDAAMLDVITESNHLMSHKTDAIVAFLTEMQYDASKTTVKRAADPSKKATRKQKAQTSEMTDAQRYIIAGEAIASNMIESLGIKRALASLAKSRAKIESEKESADYASRAATYDAALAYVERQRATKAA